MNRGPAGESAKGTIRSLTVKEKILLHLFPYSRFADAYEAPFEITQAGIAEAAGIRVQNVSNHLRPLLAEGLLDARKSHIERRPRRRKVYFLTAKGKDRVDSHRTALLMETIPFRKVGGSIEERPFSQVYQEGRRGSSLLELVEELGSRGYVAEEVEEAGISAPEDFSRGAPHVEQFYGRQRELEAVLQDLRDHPTVVLTGRMGVGKTTLAAKVGEAMRSERAVLWQRIRPWDTSFDLALRLSRFLETLGSETLFRYMTRSPSPELSGIEERLVADLQDVRSLLVFDDLHNTSEDAQDFFTMLPEVLKGQEGASALLVSRSLPAFLFRKAPTPEDPTVEVVLGGLDPESSNNLLLDLGLRDTEMEPLPSAALENPLLLKLLAMRRSGEAPAAGLDILEPYAAEDLEERLAEQLIPGLLQEAEEAAKAGDPERGIGIVESALMIETKGLRRLSSLQRLGELRRLAGDFLGSTEAYRDAIRATREPTLAARLHARIASNHHLVWRLDEAEEEIRKGMRLLPRGPSRERAELMLERAEVAAYRHDLVRAQEEVEEVMSWIPRRIRDASLEARCRGARGLLLISNPGTHKPAQALQDCLASVRILEGTGNELDLPLAHFRVAVAHQYGGKPERALREFDKSAASAARLGDLPGRLRALFAKAGCLMRLGNLGQAEELYRETFGLARKIHPHYRLIWHQLQFARLYWFQGRLEEAKGSLEHFLEAAHEILISDEKIDYLNWLVRLSVLTGPPTSAQTHLEEALGLPSQVRPEGEDVRIEWARAALYAAQGEKERADASFLRALEFANSNVRGNESRGELLLDYGRFLISSGKGRKAKSILLRARDELQIEGIRPLEQAAREELESLRVEAA